MRAFILAVVFAIAGCALTSREDAAQSVGEALALYNAGDSEQAIRLLEAAAHHDDSALVASTLSDLLILRGYFARDAKSAAEGIRIRQSVKGSQDALARSYRSYLLAMAEQARGNPQEARELVLAGCAAANRCQLIDQLTNNALLQGDRYDAEVANGISSLLLEHGKRDESVLAAHVSSEALLNYASASLEVDRYRLSGEFGEEVKDAYCHSLMFIRLREKIRDADMMECFPR